MEPIRPRRRWFQVSLLSLVLFVALCGAVMGLFALRWEDERLREELKGARAELDSLNVYDSTLVWARFSRSKEPWKWRVYFPVEQRCRLCVQAKGIGFTDFDSTHALSVPLTLGPGEFAVEARQIVQDEKDTALAIVVDDQHFTFFLEHALPAEAFHDGVLKDAAFSFEVGDKVELMRGRYDRPSYTRHRMIPGGHSNESVPSDNPSPGLLIWLEPVKK